MHHAQPIIFYNCCPQFLCNIIISCHLLIVLANTLLRFSHKMLPKKVQRLDKAARLFANIPDAIKMTILMAMRVSGYSDKDAND